MTTGDNYLFSGEKHCGIYAVASLLLLFSIYMCFNPLRRLPELSGKMKLGSWFKSKNIPCKPERRYQIKIPILKFGRSFRLYRMQIKKRCPIFSTFNSFLPSRSWAADIKLNLVSQTVHFVKEILALVFITIDFESFSPYWSIFKHRETSWNIAPSQWNVGALAEARGREKLLKEFLSS